MYKRYEDESFIGYAKRMTNMCATKDISYSVWGDCLLGEDNVYSEDNCRKAYYVVSKLLDKIDGSVEFTDIELLEEFEQMKDEIYKQRVRLQDQKRMKNKGLREEARFEALLDVYKECSENDRNIEVKEYCHIDETKETKYAIASWSDWHAGLKIDNPFNYYDVDTMIERATIIKDKVIRNCQRNDVTDLIIEINGDMVDGKIHVASRVEQEEGVLSQIITVTDLLVSLINDMKPYFNSIKVYTTLGNHGRLTPNKTESITKENFEMLIPIRLRDKLQDVPVIDSKGLSFLMYEVDERKICLAHGHQNKLATVIADFAKMYKVLPDEVHSAHFHSYKDINDCDVYVSVNGCLDGSDDYALSISKVTKPSQNLIIYGEDRWITGLKAE